MTFFISSRLFLKIKIAFTPVVLGIALLIIGIINITQGEKEKDNNLIKNNKKISYEVNKLKKVCKFCKKEILESDKVVSYKKDKWDNTYISKAHSFCYKRYKGIINITQEEKELEKVCKFCFNFQKKSWWNKKSHQPDLKFDFILILVFIFYKLKYNASDFA